MNIVVNGDTIDVEDNSSIEDLLNKLQIKDKVMAVAVNMEIVKKENWKSYKIKENDKIELLHFVGGG